MRLGGRTAPFRGEDVVAWREKVEKEVSLLGDEEAG